MNEPLLEAGAQTAEPTLWDKAPAWRGLTVVASLLTLAAVATPLLLSPPVNTALSPPPSQTMTAQIRDVEITPKAVTLQTAAPAPQHAAALTHKARLRPAAPRPQTASLQPDAGADASLANLPVGTIIVSPGVPVRVNQHNRNNQGHDWPVTITIISGPAHGTVTTQNAIAPVRFANGVTRISQVTQVFYQSASGYTGMDTFTYKRTSGDPADPLDANTYTMTIDVKQ